MTPEEIDPADRAYLAYTWCSLPWSDWVPFNADRQTFRTIPNEPGMYRIRPAGRDCLLYVGSTGQSLHTKLSELRQALRRSDLMPWSDPHPEAPGLWAQWIEWIAEGEQASPRTDGPAAGAPAGPDTGALTPGPAEEPLSPDDETPVTPFMLECSAAPLDASGAGRRGMESYLLYRYRQERGESPLCNFGRFHPRYRRSTNRKEGRRGGKLADDQQDNPAGFPSIEPLEAIGRPGDPDWMGLEWPAFAPLVPETIQAVGPGAGLYLLADAGPGAIVYIGQSADVVKRLTDHSRKSWDDRTLAFSYQIIGQSVLPHNLRELENDLIGNFYEQEKKPPEFQFRNATGR